MRGDVMKIKLDPDLIDHLHRHRHNTLTLSLVQEMYNYYNILYTKYPIISYRVPRNLELYHAYQVGDIHVYVEKDADVEGETLEFYETKKWGLHKCLVHGLKYMPINTFENH